MSRLMNLIFAAFFILFVISHGESKIVSTTSGSVDGVEITTALGKNVHAFLGIPYAQPPLGHDRFKAPNPVKPWSDTFLAHSKSKSCIQAVCNLENLKKFVWWTAKEEDTSEDCLTLNIWAPDSNSNDKAVMVWIYGGGFETGTSSLDLYDGQVLATEGDVIVVSMNYRLNIYGFFLLDPEEVPGNMGLMDQALALKWVKDNIKLFGGDPNKVTIFGESAGGASVTHHLTIPSSKGLFQRVIAQSGTSNAIFGYSEKNLAAKFGDIVAHNSGCSAKTKERKDIADCLRELDTKTLTQIAISSENLASPMARYNPVIDGSFIPHNPEKAFKEKQVDSRIDVMLGTTNEDGSLVVPLLCNITDPNEDSFISSTTFTNLIRTFLQSDDEVLVSLVKYFYTNWEKPDDLHFIREQVNHLATDLFFLCKTNSFSDLLAENGHNVFRYQFAHHPSPISYPSWMGSAHGDELHFIFGHPLIEEKGYTKEEATFSRQLITYWTNFAKYGNPNGKLHECKEEWPKYSMDARANLQLGLENKIGFGKDLRLQNCALWEKLVPEVANSLGLMQGQCSQSNIV